MAKSKLGKKALRNIEEVTMMLKMFKGQKLIGSHFNANYTALYLDFSNFVLFIDLIGAKWGKSADLRLLISPVAEKQEDFNSPFKKYKKGI